MSEKHEMTGYLDENVKPKFKHECKFEKMLNENFKQCKICGKIKNININSD